MTLISGVSYKGLLLVLLGSILCSFSWVPPQRQSPPQQTNQAKRLLLKKARLQKRLQKARKAPKRARLQQRLHQLDQNKGSKPLWSIFTFVTGLIAFILLLFTAAADGIVGGMIELSIIIGFFLVLGGLAIVLGVIYYNKRHKDKEAYPKPALAVLGIILGAVSFLIGLILLLTVLVNAPLI